MLNEYTACYVYVIGETYNVLGWMRVAYMLCCYITLLVLGKENSKKSSDRMIFYMNSCSKLIAA